MVSLQFVQRTCQGFRRIWDGIGITLRSMRVYVQARHGQLNHQDHPRLSSERVIYLNWEFFLKEPEELFETISQALLSSVDRDCLSGWGGYVVLV